MKFGRKQTMADKMAVAKSRVGKNPGVSKGVAGLPKAKISLKGTKPHKGEYAVTWKKKL